MFFMDFMIFIEMFTTDYAAGTVPCLPIHHVYGRIRAYPITNILLTYYKGYYQYGDRNCITRQCDESLHEKQL